MRRWASRAAARAGRRGAFLAFLTVLDAAYGYSLLATPAAERAQLDLLLPWPAWGGLWLATAAVCASGVFAHRDRVQFTAAAAFKTAWAGVWGWLWLARHIPLAWVSVAVWLAFAAVVLLIAGWPEVPPLPPVERL